MQNEKIYSNTLLSLVKTREQVNLMLWEIDELEKAVFKVDSNIFNETLNSKVRATTATFISSEIAGRDKTEFFKNLKDQLNSLKYLELTIAFEPTQSSLDRISDWARKNVAENICLDIKRDKRIIGGAVVTYNGRFKDYSLVHEVDAYFNAI